MEAVSVVAASVIAVQVTMVVAVAGGADPTHNNFHLWCWWTAIFLRAGTAVTTVILYDKKGIIIMIKKRGIKRQKIRRKERNTNELVIFR